MNPVNKILGTGLNFDVGKNREKVEEGYCPYCKRKLNKYKDDGFPRGYYLVCEHKDCPYYKKDGGEYLELR
jgi:hypothetical protein